MVHSTEHHVTVRLKNRDGRDQTVCLHKGDSLTIPLTMRFDGGDPIVLTEAVITVEEIDE